MKSQSQTFSGRLESLMKLNKLGIRESARIAGVSPSTLMSWKAGAVPTNHLAVLKLSRSLKVSFCFLLTGEPESGEESRHFLESFKGGQVTFEGFAHVKLVELVPLKQSNQKETYDH